MAEAEDKNREAEEENKCSIFSCIDTSGEDFKKGNVKQNLPPSILSDGAGAGDGGSDVLLQPHIDRREAVDNFEDLDVHSGAVKLKMEYPGEEVYYGSGQLINMVLPNGKLSKMFIQTAAHNLIKHNMVCATSVTAYFRVNGEDDKENVIYEQAIPVIRYAVYDRYLRNPSDRSGFDYAIASIEFPAESVAVKTLNAKFNTVPALARKLAKHHKILVCGYPGDPEKCYKMQEMKGTIYKIVEKDDGHGLIIYRDIDTSHGQSGSIIYLLEMLSTIIGLLTEDHDWATVKQYLLTGGNPTESISRADSKIQALGINVGVHTGGTTGNSPKNWGTLITPPIM